MPKPTHSKKRHGKHHRRGRDYVKVYAPYLPLLVSVIASLLLAFYHPKSGSTLAYATEMSHGGLLAATNSHRANNGVSALALNANLSSAAQAKANDMIARNYWSHTTPDGQQPWVFIDGTGYKYSKAGENLAYGFATSADAVVGWMNSPSHKANMLDSVFTEVGFGYANGASYNSSGNQTVVVAMYGKPQTLAATTQQSSPAPAAPAPAQSKPAPAPAPAPVEQPAAEPPKETAPANDPQAIPLPVNTYQPATALAQSSQTIVRSQTVLSGQTTWLLGAVTLALGGLLAFKFLHLGVQYHRFLRHHPAIRRTIRSSNNLILHHPLLDSAIAGLALLTFVLSRTVGTIL